MKPKIVVISSLFLAPFVRKATSRLNPDCELILTTYHNFKQIPAVYDTYVEQADGFLVSGRIAKKAIEIVPHKIKKPIVAFQIDTEGLYKSILDILVEKKDQDMHRIIMDFMLPVKGKSNAVDFLHTMSAQDLDPLINVWPSQSPDQMADLELWMTNEIISLYQEGKIDVVICQFTNIIPSLEEHHIPYIYPFPSDRTLQFLLHELLVKIEMNQLLANRSTIIYTAPRKSDSICEENQSLLSNAIQEFIKDQLIDSIIQPYEDGFIVFTTVQILDSITDHYQICSLSEHLNNALPFECSVGYGIGSNLNDALLHATYALRESRFIGHSFIRNEQGDMIGPLSSEKRMIIENITNKNVIYIARKCNLSTTTIQKLISYQKLTGSNKVTTQELSTRFGVTIRNANRILQNLQKGGCAHIAYTQTSHSKGRPVKVYELDFKQL